MTSIVEAVRSLLLTDTVLATQLATGLGTYRLRPDVLGQSDGQPGIVYYEISSPSDEHLGGGAGMAHTRIQFDCLASTRSMALYLRERVRLRLQGYRGTVNVGAGKTLEISGVSVEGRRCTYDTPTDGSDQGAFVGSIDLIFSHREAVGIG